MNSKRLALFWLLAALGPNAYAQTGTSQTINLAEPSCRNAPDNPALARYVDPKTGAIVSASDAVALIKLLLLSPAPAGCIPDAPTSYLQRNFPRLFNQAHKGTDDLIDQKIFDQADFILHVARWAPPAVQSASQAASQPPALASVAQLTIEQQRWYLIHQKQFLRPGRMFGAKRVYFVYLHLNKDPRASYVSTYTFGVTQAIPQNQQNLQLLASILTAKAGANDGAVPPNVWGGMQLDMWYSTSDITVDSSVTDDAKPGSAAIKLDQTLKIHNEPLGWWNVSAGVPIRKMSQLNFQSSNNTLTPQSVDKKSIFALMDFYLINKQKKDLAYSNFSWIPSLLAGVPVSQQPLHQPLFGVGWGTRFAQFYFGVIVRKQPALPAGTALTPGTSACTGWCSQFAFGINLPVKALQSALAQKPPASGGTGNSQEGAGSKAVTGAQPPGQ